jgi:hypothetical protein
MENSTSAEIKYYEAGKNTGMKLKGLIVLGGDNEAIIWKTDLLYSYTIAYFLYK